MHTNHDPIDPGKLAEMGYERRDAKPQLLLQAAFWLFVFMALSGLLAAWLIKVWHVVPEVTVEQRPFHSVKPPPGYPILQNNSDNTGDIAALRHKEAEVLTTSGPADEPGYFRIPIDDAIKLMTQRGLPVTATQVVTRPPVPNPQAPHQATVPSGGGKP